MYVVVDVWGRLRFALQAAKGMNYLHELEPPVIHRDLKSENLLIDENMNCKVADFGICTFKCSTDYTMTSVGTPIYMAPEIICKTSRAYTTKVDVYSFGILLVEMYTGIRPYSCDRFRDMFPAEVGLPYLLFFDWWSR